MNFPFFDLYGKLVSQCLHKLHMESLFFTFPKVEGVVNTVSQFHETFEVRLHSLMYHHLRIKFKYLYELRKERNKKLQRMKT